jgi:hypothetical protein
MKNFHIFLQEFTLQPIRLPDTPPGKIPFLKLSLNQFPVLFADIPQRVANRPSNLFPRLRTVGKNYFLSCSPYVPESMLRHLDSPDELLDHLLTISPLLVDPSPGRKNQVFLPKGIISTMLRRNT